MWFHVISCDFMRFHMISYCMFSHDVMLFWIQLWAFEVPISTRNDSNFPWKPPSIIASAACSFFFWSFDGLWRARLQWSKSSLRSSERTKAARSATMCYPLLCDTSHPQQKRWISEVWKTGQQKATVWKQKEVTHCIAMLTSWDINLLVQLIVLDHMTTRNMSEWTEPWRSISLLLLGTSYYKTSCRWWASFKNANFRKWLWQIVWFSWFLHYVHAKTPFIRTVALGTLRIPNCHLKNILNKNNL